MRWTIKPEPNSEFVSELAQSLAVDRLIAKLLVQRGITSFEQAKTFFRPNIDQLHDPYLLKDMQAAVERIERAVDQGENILVYGDYDVDGTTAVSLVYSYLLTRTANVSTYIPDRYEEGYGISYKGIDYAQDNEFDLIIALDCGIKAMKKVVYATKKGIDFIICDHHKPGATIPKAIAVLNPKRTDCNYPYKELCGCGVGFKLIQALEQNKDNPVEDLLPYLDLVAIAIAADIVPMTGENRTLAYFGLQVINEMPRTGIAALLAQVQKKQLTITDVVFVLAPRINAAGRMKHGNYAVELLIESNYSLALQKANEINTFNASRKELDKTITDEALQQIDKNDEQQNFSTVVYSETWHKGVIGIVASRLIESHYRPTLVFTKSGNKLAASARSVKGFDIYEALQQCAEFIEQFGGHKYAAGLTLLPENYPAFKAKFESVVAQSISQEQRMPEISIDAEIDFADINPKMYRIIQQMAPFGPGNMKPVFATRHVRDNGYGKKVGADQTHLKLNLFQGDNRTTYGAIGFGKAHKMELVHNDFDVAYTLEENEWNGVKSIQLQLKDLATSSL